MTNERKVIPMDAVDWSLPLEQLLKVLVSKLDGVAPEAVTSDYIRDKYEKGFASDLRYDKGSQYGGYSTIGLKFRSKRELDCIAKRADAVLSNR